MLFIPEIIILKSIFPFLAFLIAWEMVRKFFALYKAGQQKEIGRFICIFIFNTFGLLPIIYLLVNSTKDDSINLQEKKKTNTEIKQDKNTLKGGAKTGKKDLRTTETKRGKKQNASGENQKKQTTRKQ